MKPPDVQREVELTLSSLDRIRRAKAPIDFVEVLASKMIFAQDEVKWVNRAKIALVAMIAMAILNGIVMIKNQTDQRDLILNSVAQQYHLTGDH